MDADRGGAHGKQGSAHAVDGGDRVFVLVDKAAQLASQHGQGGQRSSKSNAGKRLPLARQRKREPHDCRRSEVRRQCSCQRMVDGRHETPAHKAAKDPADKHGESADE